MVDGAVFGGDEGQSLRPEVARSGCVFHGGEVAGVDVVDERRGGRVSHVVNYDAALALQADEGINFAVDLPDDNAFRLRAFIVGAVVERSVIGVIRVEKVGEIEGD